MVVGSNDKSGVEHCLLLEPALGAPVLLPLLRQGRNGRQLLPLLYLASHHVLLHLEFEAAVVAQQARVLPALVASEHEGRIALNTYLFLLQGSAALELGRSLNRGGLTVLLLRPLQVASYQRLLLEELMRQGLRSSQSLLGVFLEESFEQAEPGDGQLVVLKLLKVYLAVLVLLEHLVKGLSREGRLSED